MNAKTDWKVTKDQLGNYTGDYFQYLDYNRIKTNYDEVLEYGNKFYNIPKVQMSEITSYAQYPTADLFNALENNAQNVYNNSSIKLYPTYMKKTWVGNQSSPTFEDLNRLEKFSKDYYDMFYYSYIGLKRLSFRLGGGKF